MYLIDTHAHLFDSRFTEDIDGVVERAVAGGVEKIVLPAIDSDSHETLLRLAGRYPGVLYPTTGLHPTSVNDNPEWREELRTVEEILSRKGLRLYAIGETGLDLYWSKDFLESQQEAFRYQVELALSLDLPLIIHIREAFDETVSLLREYKNRGLRGIFHSFSGTVEQYRQMKTLGDFRFGIGGVATYKKAEIARTLPDMDLEDLVLETDAPYLPPVPHRGKRNESSFLPLVAEKIAELKNVSPGEVARVTTANAEAIFRF